MPERLPGFANPPHRQPGIAVWRLASSTIWGSLPPSSSTHPFIRSAHAIPTPRPTSTAPVKKIFSVLDLDERLPTVPPPWTVRTSPWGSPARSNAHGSAGRSLE